MVDSLLWVGYPLSLLEMMIVSEGPSSFLYCRLEPKLKIF